MGGGLSWLESSHLDSKIRESCCSLPLELFVRGWSGWKHLSRHRQPLAKYQIGWRRFEVGFEGGPDGQHRHGELPKPPIRLVPAEGYESLLEASVQTLDQTIRFGMVGSGGNQFDTPSSGELDENIGSKL